MDIEDISVIMFLLYLNKNICYDHNMCFYANYEKLSLNYLWYLILSGALINVFNFVLQIHHIDFDDENNVINKNVFLHKEGEIWHISASTIDKNLLTTCYNKSKPLTL